MEKDNQDEETFDIEHYLEDKDKNAIAEVHLFINDRALVLDKHNPIVDNNKLHEKKWILLVNSDIMNDNDNGLTDNESEQSQITSMMENNTLDNDGNFSL